MANDEDLSIQHVSDTALWVAHYRALESDRPDRLFNDRFAKQLVGDRGRAIAESMGTTSRYAEWSVIIRTRIIDDFIQRLVADGVNTVINLGAGLDTRPYRLALPATLRWIEVDYSNIIGHKEKILANEKPVVQLERVALDLADRGSRKQLFARLGQASSRALIITEGVVPYLTPEQVGELADDLRAEPTFIYWIAEYLSPQTYRYFNSADRADKMRKAPFRFFPPDWFGFFAQHAWHPAVVQYLGEVAHELHRPMPLPRWVRWMRPLFSKAKAQKIRQLMGYVIYKPAAD